MSSNLAAASNNFPFMYFGHRLWRLREKRGIRTAELAGFLNVPVNDYRKYESGEKLPDRFLQIQLARMLKVDFTRLSKWEQYAMRKLEDQPLKGALSHTKALTEAIERAKVTYHEMTEAQPPKEVLEILNNLQKDVSCILTLPILPMNFLMILDVLQEESETKYLHEIANFLIDKESFSGFLARDAYLGPFCFFAANLIYFSKSPCQSILDCLNRLTMEQFRELLYIAVNKHGVYTADQEIPELQNQAEFTSLSTLMARELEPYLPKTVDFNHLYMALLTQGVGIYVLYTILQPSLKNNDQRHPSDLGGVYAALKADLFDLIVYELHPVVSAMIAANWNLPVPTQDILITHHVRDTKAVSPACAVLKIINFFTDKDFPNMSKVDLTEIMGAYPQLTIAPEDFFQVCVKLNGMRKQLIERSSNVLEGSSHDAADYATDRVNSARHNPLKAIRDGYSPQPKRTDFRFEAGYQKALVNTCHARLHDFDRNFLAPKKNESSSDFAQRIEILYLRMELVHSQDQLSTAQKFKISVDELKVRLGLD